MTRSSLALAALALSLALFSACSAPARDPLEIDLNAFPLYVRSGWDEGAAARPPEGEGWTVLPPAGEGGRSARPIDLHLPGEPRRAPFSLKSYPPREYTYAIPFALGPEGAAALGLVPADSAAALPRARPVPGMHFAGLGDNWEIYLNGALLKSELERAPDGRLLRRRAVRDVRFPVDPALLKAGTNLLVVRIVADPTFPANGFHQAEPYLLADFERITRMNAEIGPLLFIGLYLFTGLYHLFMFLVRRQDRHNLFYGLFSVDLALYLFMRTHTVYYLLPDADLVFHLELASLFLILPAVGAFLETLAESRITRVTKLFALVSLLLTVLQALTPDPFSHDLLRAWQVLGLGMATYYFGHAILGRFLSEGRRRWKRLPAGPERPSLAASYASALVSTPMGNILIGGLILFATAVFDILDSMIWQLDLVLTQYGFFIFTMGTALILANRMGFLHDRLAALNLDLEGRIAELTEKGELLAASERKYRSLFEGSRDPVALVDGELAFLETNAAAKALFGLDRPGRRPRNLADCLYANPRDRRDPASRLRWTLAQPAAGGELALEIRTPLGEAKHCRLRYDRVPGGETLLRLLPEEKDPLFPYFVEGRERYELENTLQAADEACSRATARLGRYLEEAEAGFLSLCLREIIVNAIEHGNLELDFEAKTSAIREGRYFETLQERRLLPAYRERRVVLEYSISPARASFRVTDEGKGFDHRARLEAARGGGGGEGLEHGRGLALTLGAFDEIAYNAKGNQVALVKHFTTEKAR